MKLLCDANLGSRVANALIAAGYDTVRSIDRLGQSAPDEDVLDLAVREGRILLTCDSDFGELVFLDGMSAPPGILYVRFEPQTVEEIIPRILVALESGRIEGHMVVLGNSGDRVTVFPVRKAS
ncbi:MAG: DUF5615 family PIN-like protein [Novosphingobium sp.]